MVWGWKFQAERAMAMLRREGNSCCPKHMGCWEGTGQGMGCLDT